MGCFTCGESLDNNELASLRRFKDDFNKKGIVRYAYRLSTKSPLMFVREDDFEIVFKRDIKPKLKKGAEYCHVNEFQL